MAIDVEIQQQIRDAITAYLDDPSRISLTASLVNLAKKFDALPTYADIGGALLVRPDGTVLAVGSNQPWDGDADSVIETFGSESPI